MKGRYRPGRTELRIHMGARPVDVVVDTEQASHPRFKPKGFWYGFGSSWSDWVDANRPEWRKPVLQEVIVDESKLLQIGSTADFKRFQATYGFRTNDEVVDWGSIAAEYDGIEINPYRWEMRHYTWYEAWDVASGCIWNSRAVKGLRVL